MAWITYHLLYTDTHHPDHPGKYIDNAAAGDFAIQPIAARGRKGVDNEALGNTFAGRI
jgi:hypothetical protein